MANRNNLVVQGAQNAMENFKVETAAELGLQNYDQMDKGWLFSRQNGYVGGNMVKKMVGYAEQVIRQQGAEVMANTQGIIEVSPEVRQLNQMASAAGSTAEFAQQLQNLIGGGQITGGTH